MSSWDLLVYMYLFALPDLNVWGGHVWISASILSTFKSHVSNNLNNYINAFRPRFTFSVWLINCHKCTQCTQTNTSCRVTWQKHSFPRKCVCTPHCKPYQYGCIDIHNSLASWPQCSSTHLTSNLLADLCLHVAKHFRTVCTKNSKKNKKYDTRDSQ